MSQQAQKVVGLVHRRDALETKRSQLTAEIDREIAAVTAEIEAMVHHAGDRQTPVPPVAPGMPKRRRGRPPSNGSGSSYTDKLLAAIVDTPGADYRHLATLTYGHAGDDDLHRLRSVINTLKKKGRIRLMSGATRGRWEATENGVRL
jgi:hypothetical protein